MTEPRGAVAAAIRPLRSAPVAGAMLIVLVIGAFYFWTAATSPDPGRSYHWLLADSFEHGRTSLPIEPAPELLALPNPYDPVRNKAFRLHDASLYEGKYYSFFGPAPAALVFLPPKLVGIEVTDRWAAPALSLAALAAAAALLLVLIGRLLPATPTVWRLVTVAGVGLCNTVPFMLRRPLVYETAIGAALMFLMLSALLLVVGTLRERPSLALIGLGSLSLGLAVGSRANFVLAAPLLAWAWWRALDPRGSRRLPRTVRAGLAAGGPFVACLLLLVLYNVVRFGSPTELGVTYQLSSLANAQTFDYFDLGRLLPGIWFYVLQPPRWGPDFPFITLGPEYPGTLPSGFFVEPVAGLLLVAPLIALLVAVPALAASREPRVREVGILIAVAVLVCILLPIPSLVGFGGATQRYEADFASLLLVCASVVWLWLAYRPGARRRSRAALLSLGTAAIVFSAVTNVAFSMVGYGDGLRASQPATYARLERAFEWIPALTARLKDRPLLLEAAPPGASGTSAMVQIAAPEAGLASLRATFVTNTAIPSGSRISVYVIGPEGRSGLVPLTEGEEATVPVRVRSGVNDLLAVWTVVEYAGPAPAGGVPPAGAGIGAPHIVAWDPGPSTMRGG